MLSPSYPHQTPNLSGMMDKNPLDGLSPENLKRLSDKEWRMNNLYKVVNKEGKLVRFRMNVAQRQYWKNRVIRSIILKVRQLGFTTLACIDFLDDCLFTKHVNAVIIAHDKESMEKIFRRIHVAWEEFQKELGQALGFAADTSRSNMLSFNTKSQISVSLSSRSDTVHRLHISEFGPICQKYPHKAVEIITGAFPSVPSTGTITIESTAAGETGSFHDMFWKGWNSPSVHPLEFKAFFFPWQMFPEYEDHSDIEIPQQMREYQEKHKLTDSQVRWYYLTSLTQGSKMKENYPTTPEEAFETSGTKVFNPEVIEEHIKLFAKEGEKSGGWTFFEEYNPVHMYAIGADPAEGIGKDSSSAHLIDFSGRVGGITTPRVVGVFCDNTIAPDVFAYELKRAGALYGNALIAVERNGSGLSTLISLKDEYPNLYTEIRKGLSEDKSTQRLGFFTSKPTKRAIIDALKTALDEGAIIIPDKATLHELRMYEESHLRSTNYDETMTRHLDRVMSLAIAYEMGNFVTEGGPVFEGGYSPDGYAFDRHAGMEI